MNFSVKEIFTPQSFEGDPDLPVFFHKRPCFFAALGVLIGLIVFSVCGIGYAYYALAVLTLLLASAVFFKKRFPILLLCFSVLALGSAGLQCPTVIGIDSGTVEGVVAETPQQEDNRTTFLIRDVSVNGVSIRGKLRVTVYDLYGFSYGQTVRAKARFRIDDSRERYLLSQRIAADATLTSTSVKVLNKSTDLYGKLIMLREQIGERIASLFPGNETLARGMLLGSAQSGAESDDADIASFQKLGISHILAVSGLHVSVLAGAVMFLLRPIRRFLPKYGILIAFLSFYCAITAFSPSVIRASLMLLIAYPAVPLRLRHDGLSSVSLAFIVILLIDPFAFFSIGFRLSFLAVYGLITVSPLLKRAFSILRKGVRDSLATSISVTFSTLPAMAESFGSVSVISVCANLFILPLVPFFLVPAFLVTIFSYVSYPLAALFAVFPRIVLKIITWVISFGGSVDLFIPAPHGSAYIVFLSALLTLSPVCVTRKVWYKAAMAAILIAAAVLLWILF